MAVSGGRVVVGVDGTPEARAAVRLAHEEAARQGATVEVVIAFDVPTGFGAVLGARLDPDWPTPDEAREAAEAEAALVVAVVRAEMAADLRDLPPVAVSAVPGPPARVLVGTADGPTSWSSAIGGPPRPGR